MIGSRDASMALYCYGARTSWRSAWGTPRRNLLVSNKPLDNRSIAPQVQASARRRRVRVRRRTAVRDVFRLIDSIVIDTTVQHCNCTLHCPWVTHHYNSHIVDSDRDRYVIDDECVHVIELLQIIAPPCTYCETHAR